MKFNYSENKASILIGTGVFIIIISSIVFIIKGSWTYSINDSINEGKIGVFGDFIAGTVGTLFSLAGIILFYVALKEQRKDFKTNEQALKTQIDAFQQQLKEFELQREELAETRMVYVEQSKTLKSQRYEETFYSFMNVFIEIRKSLALGDYNVFFKEIAAKLKVGDPKVGHEGLQQIKEVYEKVYIECRSQLASYFIIFYRLLKMIEMSDLDEKETYHKILRSIISKDELLVLYYNYHSKFGQKPIPIVLKYDYFKHLEKLSKIELEALLKETDQVFALNSLVDILSEKIIQCIRKAKSLEEEEAVFELGISKGVFIRIEVIDELCIKLITDTETTSLFGRPSSEFIVFLENLLIDIIYSSYFADFDMQNLQRITTDDRNQVIESFNFSNINHIS